MVGRLGDFRRGSCTPLLTGGAAAMAAGPVIAPASAGSEAWGKVSTVTRSVGVHQVAQRPGIAMHPRVSGPGVTFLENSTSSDPVGHRW